MGLCSPQCLYDKNREIFKKRSYMIYKERTANFLKKKQNEVTDEDILFYLNNSPDRIPYFSSSSIFFNILSIKEAHPDIQKYFKNFIEIKVDYEFLKHKSKIVLVGPGKKEKFINWSLIYDEEFREKVKKIYQEKPDKKYIFKKVPHIALRDIYHIEDRRLIF
jgi:hypothetical protein